MKKPVAFVLLLAFVTSAGCGKKGPLQLPVIRTPQKVEALTLFQRGDKIFVEWKNPATYVDGAPLQAVTEVEIRVLEQPKSETAPSSNDFETRAHPAAVIKGEQLAAYRKIKDSDAAGFSYPYSVAGRKIGPLKFIFAVRVKDDRSHESVFSPAAEIEPQTSPLPPRDFELRSVEGRIHLVWQAPAANIDTSAPARVAGYNVYRESMDGSVKLLNSSLVKELEYADDEFEYGHPLRYFIRASATDVPPYLESDDSERREIVPKDVFPPAAPIGLTPVTGKGFIALSWEPNRERDLAGYKVWRRVEAETDGKLLTPQLLIENAYVDAAVEKGLRYRYAISAVDRNGNESSRTEAIAESSKDEL